MKKKKVGSYAHFASFLRFIAAKVGMIEFLTRSSPRCSIYRMACFSLASAKTRSIVWLRLLKLLDCLIRGSLLYFAKMMHPLCWFSSNFGGAYQCHGLY